jgi:hypothetical protein
MDRIFLSDEKAMLERHEHSNDDVRRSCEAAALEPFKPRLEILHAISLNGNIIVEFFSHILFLITACPDKSF